MLDNAQSVASFLKAMANENRLLILYHLVDGEKSVTELELLLGIRQPTLSQQLARLRADGLVATRRAAKLIYYSLASDDAYRVIRLLDSRFGSAPGGDLPKLAHRELVVAE
ncbi:MAG: metalloregulator ArsR/SmtB family transcription factor [Alphaproteobacteria bacterium]